MKYRLIFCLLFCAFTSIAQKYSFITYSIAQGLPQSQVTQITQDKEGFLWIGTLGGLSKFAGDKFDNYSVENGLFNNRISFLGFIHDTLWVGHEEGISVQSGNHFVSFSSDKIDKGVKVVDVCEFKNKKIIATNGNGLFFYTKKGLQQIVPQFTNNYDGSQDFLRVRDLLVIDDKIYVGTRLGLFISTDLIHFSLVKGTEYLSISKLGTNKSGAIYFTTFGDGVQKWDGTKFQQLHLNGTDFPTSGKDLFIDHNQNVWVSTKVDGVIRFSKNEILQLNTHSGLPLDNVACTFEDRENNLWFGTDGKGLVRFTDEAFTYFSEETGLSSDLVMSVLEDDFGHFWFSSYAKGISKLADHKFTYFDDETTLTNNTIWCSLKDRKGRLWFGTSSGITIFSANKREIHTVENTPELASNKVSGLFQDKNGRIWIGGKDGIAYFENGVFHAFDTKSVKGIENVRHFEEVNGIIYFVAQLGLYSISNNSDLNYFEIPSNQSVAAAYSVTADKTGRIWVGTEEGLFYLKDNQLKMFDFSQENSSNFITFINRQSDRLWVGTNNGLFLFSDLDELTEIQVKQFGIQDGLVSLETNLNSGFVDKKGRFWFGTSDGLMQYNPKKEKAISKVKPNIVFKQLKVNFEDVNLLSFAKKVDENGIPIDLELPYSKKHLVFQFTGVTLTNPNKVFYQYRLLGFDDKWSPEIPNSEITYSNLPSGDYIVCARVRNDNNGTSKEIHIPFSIKPPYYATWWFITLCVILFVLLIFGLFSLRINQLHRRQHTERLEYTTRLRTLEQQSLNASMNRHFIFNALNSIQYFINTKDRLSANRYLSQFAKLIRKNLDSSTSFNNSVSLEEELDRLNLYLSLESMRFSDKFDYHFDIDPAIDPESILVPSMIFQPFIENSIIHGILPQTIRKGIISFKAKKTAEDVVEFIIEDNGVGYTNSIQQKRTDGDHQSKGMSITSSRIELLRKISGKVFNLVGPEDILNDTGESIGTKVSIIISINMLDY